jgi:acyl carrier protein/short-subunit dehydrogenase
VLVTGGTGVIGGRVAGWLAGRGVPALVLASRSGPAAAGVPALAAELAAAGTTVTVAACDAGSRTQLAGLIGQIKADGQTTVGGQITAAGRPLAGVVHAAGIAQDTPLDQASTGELAAVLAAKAGGAAALDELTAGLDLDLFVLFSSAAATWGSGRQPAYAAANASLDALAQRRRARGLPATSVAWGLWGTGGGMASRENTARLSRHGLTTMDPGLAIHVLADAIDAAETQVTIADVDWARFMPTFTLRRPSPLLSDLPETSHAVSDGGPNATAAPDIMLIPTLAGLPSAEQDQILAGLVLAQTAAVLGHGSPETVNAARPFTDLGIGSLAAVELRNRLTAATGLKLPATLIYDYPTTSKLAEYLRAQLVLPDGPDTLARTEIARLEDVLSSLPADSPDGADVMTRLENMLSRWGFRREQMSAVADRDIETATPDEMFKLIEREFRKP